MSDPACPLCQRQVALTFHHLIPKKMHRRTYFKKNYKRAQLHEGIMICRLCHDGLHDLYVASQLNRLLRRCRSSQSCERQRQGSDEVSVRIKSIVS